MNVKSVGLTGKKLRSQCKAGRAGHTLIEVLVAFTVLVVGAVAFLKVIAFSSSSNALNLETVLAKEAARAQIETLMGIDYREVFARYNLPTSDDPGGGIPAPGPNFAVIGLDPLDGDADGMAGEIIFPNPSATSLEIREDIVNQGLGCPMDLNGDSIVDSVDHAGDCLVLPVLVRIRWKGSTGNCLSQFKTVLGSIQ